MAHSRWWLPVLLGLIAGVGNYTVLARTTRTAEYVALRTAVQPGEEITPDKLMAVKLPHSQHLAAEAHLHNQASALLGKRARRWLPADSLLLRADLEGSHQLRKDLLAEGHTMLVLPARKAAVASQPQAGEYVNLSVRLSGATTGSADRTSGQYGAYLFLGWYEAPPVGSSRTSDLVWLAVAVRTDPQPRDAELWNIQASGASERIIAVNMLRGQRNAPTASTPTANK